MNKNMYIEKLIEQTTQNTIDDCVCTVEIIACLIVFWFLLVIMC